MKLYKITDKRNAPTRRRYDDACGTAHGLDLIGERWALLVMRELMLGPKRFRDLRADLPGISANVLSQRLEGLEAAGLLVRRKLAHPAGIWVYDLTDWGYEAEPIVQHLGRWAARSPAHDPTLPLSATSLMLSFRTMFDPDLAKGMDARIGFRIGVEIFAGTISNRRLDVARGDPNDADFVMAGDPEVVAAAVYGKVPFADLEAAGALAVTGDRALAERFVALFNLPPKAGTPA